MATENKRVLLCLCHMSGRELDYVHEAFSDNWVVPLGPNVTGFEEDLQHYLRHNTYVAALSAGTAAIHLGLVMLGVGRDDEVICQSLTFSASCNPIVYQGARPVLVDSEPTTWNMSPQLLEKAILDRKEKTGRYPKAIIVADLYGMPAQWDEILAVASKYGIPVLEDAAEAMGSFYKERPCSTFGQFGALSFNGNKMITTSGGGALVCHTPEEKKEAISLATQAREPFPYYQHEKIGYNYRLSNISAGIGRGQMFVLENHLAHHRMIHGFYSQHLSGLRGIRLFSNPSDDFDSNYWLCNILIDKEITGFTPEDLRLAMEEENIETRPIWKPMHLQPVFRDCPAYTDGTSEQIFESGLCLPAGPWVGVKEAQRVVDVIRKMIKQHSSGQKI